MHEEICVRRYLEFTHTNTQTLHHESVSSACKNTHTLMSNTTQKRKHTLLSGRPTEMMNVENSQFTKTTQTRVVQKALLPFTHKRCSTQCESPSCKRETSRSREQSDINTQTHNCPPQRGFYACLIRSNRPFVHILPATDLSLSIRRYLLHTRTNTPHENPTAGLQRERLEARVYVVCMLVLEMHASPVQGARVVCRVPR